MRQGVCGEMMFGDVIPNIVRRPIQQGGDAQQSIPFVFKDFGMGAVLGLVAADAGDPCVESLHRFLHRLHLADVATQVGIGLGQVCAEMPQDGAPLFVGAQVDDVQVPDLLDMLTEEERIPEVHARIKKEDARLGLDLLDHVQKGDTLGLEG